MDFFSHILLGILLSIFLLNPLGYFYMIYGSILAFIPDLDVFFEPLQRIKKIEILAHKGWSHSFFGALVISFLFALPISLLFTKPFLNLWVIGFIFYSLHVVLDFLAASKIPIFFPLTKKRFRFFIERAINIFLSFVSGGILIFFLITLFTGSIFLFADLYPYLSLFYLFYFSYRIISKIWVHIRTPNNSTYIPGIFPCIYYIYKNETKEDIVEFSLTKKTQFLSNKSKIINSEIKLNSNEWRFYQKAKELSKNYLFFQKWDAIIPKITKHKETISVKLILGEGLYKNQTYILEIVFDNETEEILKMRDNYIRIE